MIESVKSQDHLSQLAEIFFAPETTETLFWRPRYIANSPVMQHVPFLFWLMGSTRPRNVVVFGSRNGVVPFALCQAMDKLNISGHCLSIGFWTDTETGKKGVVPSALRGHTSQLYDDILQWRCETSACEALAKIAPGSLDLLYVDACDLPEGRWPEAEEWLGAINQTGILVIHGDLSADGRAGAVEIPSNGRQIVRFPDEKGLMVLPLSDAPPAQLIALQEASHHGILLGEIGSFFRRLGQGHLAVAKQIEALELNRIMTLSLNTIEHERDEALSTCNELHKNCEDKSSQLSNLQEKLYNRETKLADFEQQIEAANQEMSRIKAEQRSDYENEAQIFDLKHELDTARQTIASVKGALEHERKTRFNETAALTQHIESFSNVNQSAAASSAMQSQKWQQEIKLLEEKNSALSLRVNDLINSTSWRVTLPMRKIKSAFSRK